MSKEEEENEVYEEMDLTAKDMDILGDIWDDIAKEDDKSKGDEPV